MIKEYTGDNLVYLGWALGESKLEKEKGYLVREWFVIEKDGGDNVHYGFNCGQHIKFTDFRRVMENHSGLTLEAGWKRCIDTDEMRKVHNENALKRVENEICVNDIPMVRIMRDMYNKTLFESIKEE